MFRKLGLCIVLAIGCMFATWDREGHTADKCPDVQLKQGDCPPEAGDTTAWSQCKDVLLEENCGKYGLVFAPVPNSFLTVEKKGWRVNPKYVEKEIGGYLVWVPATQPCYTRRTCAWDPTLKCYQASVQNTWQFYCTNEPCLPE
jgi:hypothetical protein